MELDERLVALEDAIYHISEAIAALENTGNEDIVEQMGDQLIYLNVQRNELEAQLTAENQRELASMTRDYWRDAM